MLLASNRVDQYIAPCLLTIPSRGRVIEWERFHRSCIAGWENDNSSFVELSLKIIIELVLYLLSKEETVLSILS